MLKCADPFCKKKFKRAQDAKMHFTKVHSTKKRKGALTLQDAIIALKVKRDSFDEVLLILEGLSR